MTENTGKKAHVLIVDDEAPVRMLMAKILADQEEFRVSLASDGFEAVDFYKNHSHEVDVVLIDLAMPTMSGIEVFLELKKINPDVRGVLCSGFLAPGETDKFISLYGFSDFLPKPFEIDSLIQIIRKFL